ncbi:rap guanine nucleotide exchange factor 1-like [Lampris incognitus]|uniref:rap guanine nucleotide exchange factor 1-like n=1 Tax=Lampris incognitus TaxID=2546036 RepID=UPI0024B5F163|nr:rap guanine nucleotide exchange factor 1-like [Lampris incognitus]
MAARVMKNSLHFFITLSVCVLVEQERAVVSALQYFKTLVDKLVVDQHVVSGLLCGSAGQVLEAVHALVQLEPRIQRSKTVSSCLSGLFGSLAQLIHWADQVMLQGIQQDKEAIATVTTVIRAVLDGTKELVRLAAERQDGSPPSSPVQSQSNSGPSPSFPGQSQQVVGHTSSCCEDQQTSSVTTLAQPSQKPGAPKHEEEERVQPAPPKPPKLLPMPLTTPNPCCKTDTPSPPILPPKRRQSSGPSPCRIAIVTPVRRETWQQKESEIDTIKPSLSCSVFREHTPPFLHQEVDPDYEFLDRDLSCVEIPPSSSLPPALPEKRRRSAPAGQVSQASPAGEDSAFIEQYPAQFDKGISLDNSLPYDQPPPELSPSGTPPPLPEKKRHIHQYLQFLSTYSAPAADLLFYQRPSNLSQRYTDRQRQLETAYQLTHTHPDSQHDPHSSTHHNAHHNTHPGKYQDTHPDIHPDTHSETHYDTFDTHSDTHHNTQPEIHSERKADTNVSSPLPPAPVLPPKKKHRDSAFDNGLDKVDKKDKESSQSVQQTALCGERSSKEQEKDEEQKKEEEEGEELLLINQPEVLGRIIMKKEEEEGLDVKAASPDILLVYATETDSSDQVLYCEAFLLTYRSFMSTHDVITKLQSRYRHLCKGSEPAYPRASKNTFLLLVRAVEELCAIELDADLQALLMDLVFNLVIGGELGLAHLLRTNILSKLEQRRHLIGSPLSLRPLSARGVAARPGTLHDFRSQDIAEQLTLMDSELFCKIELPEVLLWSKEQNEEKSPNLTEFTQHFNNVSFWVRSVIMLQQKAQDREKLFLKFLKVMKHLRKLNNFNSYLSILSALDSAPLRRLDWQRHTAEALEEYSSLIDSSSSFRTYRAALADVDPPCIPYLGLILQDLTFVHLGNPDLMVTSQGSKVNFSKCWQQFNILDTLRSFQQIRYSLQPNDEIVSFFNDFSDHLAEEALWELSLRLRPRNNPRANQR